MPTFSYKGIDPHGREETGEVVEANETLAFETLQSRGLTVFEVVKGNAPANAKAWYLRDIGFSRARLRVDDLALLADLLAVLFKAKLPLIDIVRIVASSSENRHIIAHFNKLEAHILDGGSFANGFEQTKNLYPPLFTSFIKLGENSNSLGQIMEELAKYYRLQREIQAKVTSALIYPVILICAALLLVLLVVFYLAPTLSPIFDSTGVEVPRTLSAMLSMRDFLTDYWLFLVLGTTGCIIGFLVSAQNPIFHAWRSKLLSRTPLFGSLRNAAAMSRAARSLQILLASGASLADALLQTGEMLGNDPYAVLFTRSSENVREGGTASEVLAEDKSLPKLFVEMFRIGETTNRLGEILNSLTRALDLRVEQSTTRLLQLLTPALTLLIGGGMGFLIYTIMGAILEVNELAF